MIFEENQKETGWELPDLFKDPAFKKSSHWTMSTSHCGSSALTLFGFGPVVNDGFGIGYMIKNYSIHFNVTSKYGIVRTNLFSLFFFSEKTSTLQSGTSSWVFSALLEQSLLLMQAIALSNPETVEKAPKALQFTHPTSTSDFTKPKA
jgi:carnitine O-acetyltransferase